jgi:hypothetical protein
MYVYHHHSASIRYSVMGHRMKPIKVSLGGVTAFAGVAAVAYLVSYWGSFGVNIFQFASLDSLVAATGIPLAATFAVYLFLLVPFMAEVGGTTS